VMVNNGRERSSVMFGLRVGLGVPD